MTDAPDNTKPPKADFAATHVAKEFKADRPLISCRFDASGKYVFAGDEMNAVYRWDVESGKLTKLGGHESWVRDFAFLPDGSVMIAADYAGRLSWWPVVDDEPKVVRTIDAHAGWVRCVAVAVDGAMVASGGNDNLVKLWHAETGEPAGELAKHESHIYSLLFHPDGKHLLSGDLMGQVHQWELASGKAVRSFDGGDLQKYDPTFRAHYGGVRSMSLSHDGKHLACAGLHKCTNAFAGVNEPLVMRFDWESQKKVQSHEHGIRAIAWRALFHREGFLVAAAGGGAGGHLLFWNDDAKAAHAFKLPNIAREMDLHPDGLRIATAHFDSKLRVSLMGKKG